MEKRKKVLKKLLWLLKELQPQIQQFIDIFCEDINKNPFEEKTLVEQLKLHSKCQTCPLYCPGHTCLATTLSEYFHRVRKLFGEC